MNEEEIVRKNLKKLANNIFSKLNDVEKSYLLMVNNEKNKQINELHQELQRKDNIINGIKKEIDWLLERQYDSERFAKENGFNTYLPAKVNLEHLKNKIKKLEQNNLTLEQTIGIAND